MRTPQDIGGLPEGPVDPSEHTLNFWEKQADGLRAAVGANGEKKTFELNMEDILERGKTEQDILLQPNDFIIVPTRLMNF